MRMGVCPESFSKAGRIKTSKPTYAETGSPAVRRKGYRDIFQMPAAYRGACSLSRNPIRHQFPRLILYNRRAYTDTSRGDNEISLFIHGLFQPRADICFRIGGDAQADKFHASTSERAAKIYELASWIFQVQGRLPPAGVHPTGEQRHFW